MKEECAVQDVIGGGHLHGEEGIHIVVNEEDGVRTGIRVEPAVKGLRCRYGANSVGHSTGRDVAEEAVHRLRRDQAYVEGHIQGGKFNDGDAGQDIAGGIVHPVRSRGLYERAVSGRSQKG